MDITYSGVAPTVSDGISWAGSEAAYVAAYRSMLRVAFVLTGSSATAEDVVHDVFVSTATKLATVDDPIPYLRRSVVNRCNSLHRRAARERRFAASSSPPGSSLLDPGLTELRDALAAIDPKRRAAIVLRFLCDLPDEEIAATLNCRPATVRTLVHRGLADLRKVLK